MRIPARVIAAALCLGASACAPAARPRHVLLLVLDTTRADAVGAYRMGPAHTPALDALAARGVLFSEARSTSAWTVPAHGSLFTGLYPSAHGAHGENERLAPDQVTLAERLQPSHETAGFSENPHIIRAKGYSQGFDVYEETWRSRRIDAPPITLERVADWLAKRRPDRPFFLFVNLMTPHLPYRPPPHLRARFLPAGVSAESAERYMEIGEQHARLYMSGALTLHEADLELLRALYRADVSFADERSAKLLALLGDAGVLAETLVVVVGDHGENIGDHGLMEHQLCLYESLLRVPMIVAFPGLFDGGRRSRAPVQLVDVPPTVLDALGRPAAEWAEMAGESLVAGEPAEDRPLRAEYMRPLAQRRLFAAVNAAFDFDRFDRRLASLQRGSWKLIVSDRGETELYDLARDPHETRDLSREEPARVAALRAELPVWSEPERESGPAPALDSEAERELRSLGYLE